MVAGLAAQRGDSWPLLGLVGAGYLALTLSYAVLLLRFVILYIVAIAGGFVLRAVVALLRRPRRPFALVHPRDHMLRAARRGR